MSNCYFCGKELMLGFEKFVGLCLKHHNELDTRLEKNNNGDL